MKQVIWSIFLFPGAFIVLLSLIILDLFNFAPKLPQGIDKCFAIAASTSALFWVSIGTLIAVKLSH